MKKLNKEDGESNCDNDDMGSSDSETETQTNKRKGSGSLFTKIGVPLKDEEDQIKSEFRKQANLDESEDSGDDLLVKKHDSDSDQE